MGAVFEEFERELERFAQECAGRPREEMRRLFLLALEREQMASVGYRESLIAQRVASLPIDAEAREILRHALLWAWKDEEMHAIYIRGVLLRLGSLPLRVRTYLQQAAGGIGGWAASVGHHLRFRQAPLSWTVATVISWLGLMTGKVPKAVRAHLDFGPFRGFCLFNVDAEQTASRCWERLSRLARDEPELLSEFVRMKEDEDRHAQVFATFAAAFDEHDRLVEGESASTLADKMASIGPFFLPAARRGHERRREPARVWIGSGLSAGDKRAVFLKLLESCGLAERLLERARAQDKDVSALKVAVKATFMIGYHRKDRSPITDPDLIAILAERLRELGVADVAVVESPTIYDRFYRNRSVHEVARYFGIQSPHFRLVDASQDQVAHHYPRGMAQYSVSRTWKDADLRVSFAKMRSNPVDVATLTVANLEGLGPRHDQYFFAERQAHRDTANMMLLAEFPMHLALLDAYDSASDGLLGMMGGPRPKVPRRIYASGDAMALDRLALRHLGVDDPDRCPTLRAARHWFGEPEGPIEVIGADEPIAGWKGPFATEWSTLLSLLAYPVYQFGSGRGSLFVPEMDEAAFPPVAPPGPWLRFARGAIQASFGLRHPR
jgi:uncharacterized protein (DUF362 family)